MRARLFFAKLKKCQNILKWFLSCLPSKMFQMQGYQGHTEHTFFVDWLNVAM